MKQEIVTQSSELADLPLKHCGYRPWNERQAKAKFYEILKEQLR